MYKIYNDNQNIRLYINQFRIGIYDFLKKQT